MLSSISPNASSASFRKCALALRYRTLDSVNPEAARGIAELSPFKSPSSRFTSRLFFKCSSFETSLSRIKSAVIVDRVLVSVGRRANGDGIAAAAAGVEVEASGIIRVDECLRTNVHHILAIGDITGEPMLAHRASHQGKVAAEVLSGHKSTFDARVIPSVAYTDPET